SDPSPSLRNAVRLPFGIDVHLHRNAHSYLYGIDIQYYVDIARIRRVLRATVSKRRLRFRQKTPRTKGGRIVITTSPDKTSSTDFRNLPLSEMQAILSRFDERVSAAFRQ